jgi:hypothetical protein
VELAVDNVALGQDFSFIEPLHVYLSYYPTV